MSNTLIIVIIHTHTRTRALFVTYAHFLTCADILLHPAWVEYGGHKKICFLRYGVEVEDLEAPIEK
jgi:hypothetical protein